MLPGVQEFSGEISHFLLLSLSGPEQHFLKLREPRGSDQGFESLQERRMPTLILSPRHSPDTQYLWRESIKDGWEVYRAKRYLPPVGTSEPWCCYGELMFCDAMAARLDLALLDPADDWLANLPQEYLQREVTASTLSDAHKIKERKFIKPANDKLFPAAVYERGDDVPSRYVDLTCPILISDVVSFDAEVRCYVLDRAVSTASAYYKASGLRFNATKGGASWLANVLKDPRVEVPSAVVIDVGLVHGKGWVVIEANQAYASGVYDEADGKALLPVILRASGPRSSVRPEDEKYIR